MQSQLVCSGCRTVLLYPRGATNVCCAICNVVTAVPPAGMEMVQLICGGCRTLLMHARGAYSVRCSCCHTVNLVPAPPAAPPPAHNNIAHVNCGNCHTMLMYPAGAPSVKCAICHFITNANYICFKEMAVGKVRRLYIIKMEKKTRVDTKATNDLYWIGDTRVPIPVHRPNGISTSALTPTYPVPHSRNQTVVVQNPMTVDESGKLVNNVVVGVTT